MSAACPKYLFKVTDPSFSALFQLRQGGFAIANGRGNTLMVTDICSKS